MKLRSPNWVFELGCAWECKIQEGKLGSDFSTEIGEKDL